MLHLCLAQDPRTGDIITHVAEAQAQDVDLAVKAARKSKFGLCGWDVAELHVPVLLCVACMRVSRLSKQNVRKTDMLRLHPLLATQPMHMMRSMWRWSLR